MKQLLANIPYRTLLKGVPLREVMEAGELLDDFMRSKHEKSLRLMVALAYTLGVRQGVHQERARRKGNRYHAAIIEVVKTIHRPDLLERLLAYAVHITHHEQGKAVSV